MKNRALIVALIVFVPLTARAQFTPLCDDGMGGSKPCIGRLNVNHLPTVPTYFGGTGVTGAFDGRYFAGSADGTPRFKPIDRKHIPGISFDFSTTPGPLLEVTKDVGTNPQLIAKFPGDGGTFNRWYVGQRGMFMTFNCSTSDGVTCIKDSTAVPSVTLEMGSGSILRWSGDSATGTSTWRMDMAQRSTEWRPSLAAWTVELGSGSITAQVGGTVRNARIGDVVHFPVQWPTRLKRAPTKFLFGPAKVVGVSGALSVSNADETGAVLNVDVGSNGDFTWIGQIHAAN